MTILPLTEVQQKPLTGGLTRLVDVMKACLKGRGDIGFGPCALLLSFWMRWGDGHHGLFSAFFVALGILTCFLHALWPADPPEGVSTSVTVAYGTL
jgi:hypothetical protein